MKKIVIAIGIVGLTTFVVYYLYQPFIGPKYRLAKFKAAVNEIAKERELQNGDLIFQTSLSRQSEAIQLATQSPYSHCGLIYQDGGRFYVFEAGQPVRRISFDKWIAGGEDGKYVVKRLKNAEQVLTPAVLKKMKQVCEGFNGKNYDQAFDWSDEKIYCSELIWKVYQRSTGLEIGKLEKLGNFDLTNKVVKEKVNARYGKNIPLDEIVISPGAIFNSELLETVRSN